MFIINNLQTNYLFNYHKLPFYGNHKTYYKSISYMIKNGLVTNITLFPSQF